MAFPTGVGYVADALSKVISDVFSGQIEGRKLALQEEEASRKEKDAIMRQAFFPQQWQHGELTNQNLSQGMRQSAELHPWAVKQAGANLASTEAQTAGTRASTARTIQTTGQEAAKFPYELENVKLQPRLTESQITGAAQDLKIKEQQLADMKTLAPYLGPEAAAKVSKAEQDLKESKYKHGRLLKLEADRRQAIPELIAAAGDPNKTLQVFAKYELDDRDPYVLGTLQLIQANSQGRMNAAQLSNVVRGAQNNAEQWGKDMFYMMTGKQYSLERSTEEQQLWDWLVNRKKAELLQGEKALGVEGIPGSMIQFPDAPDIMRNNYINSTASWFGYVNPTADARKQMFDLFNYYQKTGVPFAEAWRKAGEEIQRRKVEVKQPTLDQETNKRFGPNALPSDKAIIARETPGGAPAPELHPAAKSYLDMQEQKRLRDIASYREYGVPYERLPSKDHRDYVEWFVRNDSSLKRFRGFDKE